MERSAGRCMSRVTSMCSAGPSKTRPRSGAALNSQRHTSLSSTFTEFKHINMVPQSSLLAAFGLFITPVMLNAAVFSPSGNPAVPQELHRLLLQLSRCWQTTDVPSEDEATLQVFGWPVRVFLFVSTVQITLSACKIAFTLSSTILLSLHTACVNITIVWGICQTSYFQYDLSSSTLLMH